jgi:membrane protein
MRLDSIISLTKETLRAWSDDYAPSMGAALAYYTMFSIAPLLLIVISIAGVVFGREAAQGEIIGQLTEMMGRDGAHAVEGLLISASEPANSLLATLLSVGLLVFGATTVFAELQDAFDRIWRVPSRKRMSGIWILVRARLLSFGMMLGIAFLLMVSLVFSAAIAALGKWWGPYFGGWESLLQLVNFVFSFGMASVLFALIYKIMPRVHLEWRDVWIGAAFTAALFVIGKHLIGIYIGKSAIASGFGAAASLVVMLIWVYYSAQIFLLGAEFTWVYAHRSGSKMGISPGPPEVASRAP